MRFSVIVPVYGVEKYLDECVLSILSQTYTDFELILVDDKSPDNCPAMCDGYAKMDSRVRVVHKIVNEGLGFARNSGMEIAQGDYIVFVDSDDTIASNMLERYSNAVKDAPDVVACGLTQCRENKKGKTVRRDVLIPKAMYSDTTQAKADAFAMLIECRVFQYAWNKAYKREFLLSVQTKFEQTKLRLNLYSTLQAIK
jgi:glycosyltransferase involved in cell wall biosynthesis